MHQVIYNMVVAKDIDNKAFDYIYPWDETLASIAWEIRSQYHLTIGDTPVQASYGRYIIFYLASVVDLRFITSIKHQKVNIDHVCENAKRFISDYAIHGLVYVDNIGIYHKLYYNKQGP